MASQPPLHPQRFVRPLSRRWSRAYNARRASAALCVRRGEVERVDIQDLVDRQFVAFDPAYHSNRDLRGRRLDALREKIRPDARRSREIMIEAEWLRDYTADWKRLDRQLALLAQSLASGDQDTSRQNDDGSWTNSNRRWMENDPNLSTSFALIALAHCKEGSAQP